MENEDLFKEEEITQAPETKTTEETATEEIAVETSEPTTENDEIDDMLADLEIGDLSDADMKEVEIKEEDLDKVFEIESAEIRNPILKDANGPIAPKAFNPNKPEQVGWTSKMHITYKDADYISILGKVRWYPGVNRDTGKKMIRPWFNTKGLDDSCLTDQFCSPISRLYYLVCKKQNVEVGKIGLKAFRDYLNSGVKVKLGQYKTKWEGSMRYRIDIKEIVD